MRGIFGTLFGRRFPGVFGHQEVIPGPPPPPENALVYYVSPSGSDANAGTEASPLETLEEARNRIRTATGRTSVAGSPGTDDVNWFGAVVYLLPGRHKRSTTFYLDGRDSGTETYPIVYDGSDTAYIDGSVDVQVGAWSQVNSSDPFWGRLPTATRDSIWKLDLSAIGVAVGALTNNSSRAELIDDDEVREMARFPAYPEDRTDAPDFLRLSTIVNGSTGVFTDNDPHLAAYDLTDQSPVIWHYPKVEYAGRWDRISITGSGSTKTITPSTFAGASGSSIKPMSLTDGGSGRYAIYNCLEDLTVEGTYCLVEGDSVMYYVAPGGTAPTAARVTGMDAQMVEGDGVSWVNFQNVTIEGGRRDGWFLYASSDMVFTDVVFQNLGVGTAFGTGGRATYWGGILSTGRTSINDNCHRLTFTGCTFQHLGGRALGIITGDRANLVDGECVIATTTFQRNCRLQRTIPNMNITGWGFEVDTCVFTELPYVGLQHYALTHLHDSDFTGVLLEAGDYGATYTSNSATANRGTIIEDCTFTDVGAHTSPTPPSPGSNGWGVYLDDLVSGVTVRDNIFVRCGNGMQFTGSDHTITGNQFTDCHHIQGLTESETMTLGSRSGHTAKIESRDAEMLSINGSGQSVASEPWATYWPAGVNELPGGSAYSVRGRARNNVVTGNQSATWSTRWPNRVLIQVRDSAWLIPNQPSFFTQQNYEPGTETLRDLSEIDRL